MSKLAFRSKKEGLRFKTGNVRGFRSATGTPTSWTAKDRSFDFVLATESPCRTWRETHDYRVVEVDEILPMSGLVDLDDFVGSGIFEDHRTYRPPIGVIDSARIEGSQLVCRGRLSPREEVDVIAVDIQAGIRRAFSVGFEILEDGELVGDLIRVRRWRAKEASLVTVPADDKAKIRSRSAGIPNNSKRTGNVMDSAEFKKRAAAQFDTFLDGLVTMIEADGGEGGDGNANAGNADDAQLRGLRDVAKKRGLSTEFAAFEASGATVEKLQDLLLSGIRSVSAPVDTATKTNDGAAGGKRSGLIKFDQTTHGKSGK